MGAARFRAQRTEENWTGGGEERRPTVLGQGRVHVERLGWQLLRKANAFRRQTRAAPGGGRHLTHEGCPALAWSGKASWKGTECPALGKLKFSSSRAGFSEEIGTQGYMRRWACYRALSLKSSGCPDGP